MRGFDITTDRVDPTTRSKDTTEKVTLDGLGGTAATVEVVLYEVTGGITHPRGLTLSLLTEVSKSLLFALIRPLQRKL